MAWYALVAPAGTPVAVVDKINASVNQALHDPEIQKRLANLSAEPVGGSPQDTVEYFQEEIERWKNVITSRTCHAWIELHETQHRSNSHHPCRQPAAAGRLARSRAHERRQGVRSRRQRRRGCATAVGEIVRKQAELGIDVIDDGEYGKPSFVSYINERLGGYEVEPRPGRAING